MRQSCFLRLFTQVFCSLNMLFINDDLEGYEPGKHRTQLFVKILLLYTYIYKSKKKV